MQDRLKQYGMRIVTATLVVGVLAGCAHSGEIPRSPCACDFRMLPNTGVVSAMQGNARA